MNNTFTGCSLKNSFEEQETKNLNLKRSDISEIAVKSKRRKLISQSENCPEQNTLCLTNGKSEQTINYLSTNNNVVSNQQHNGIEKYEKIRNSHREFLEINKDQFSKKACKLRPREPLKNVSNHISKDFSTQTPLTQYFKQIKANKNFNKMQQKNISKNLQQIIGSNHTNINNENMQKSLELQLTNIIAQWRESQQNSSAMGIESILKQGDIQCDVIGLQVNQEKGSANNILNKSIHKKLKIRDTIIDSRKTSKNIFFHDDGQIKNECIMDRESSKKDLSDVRNLVNWIETRTTEQFLTENNSNSDKLVSKPNILTPDSLQCSNNTGSVWIEMKTGNEKKSQLKKVALNDDLIELREKNEQKFSKKLRHEFLNDDFPSSHKDLSNLIEILEKKLDNKSYKKVSCNSNSSDNEVTSCKKPILIKNDCLHSCLNKTQFSLDSAKRLIFNTSTTDKYNSIIDKGEKLIEMPESTEFTSNLAQEEKDYPTNKNCQNTKNRLCSESIISVSPNTEHSYMEKLNMMHSEVLKLGGLNRHKKENINATPACILLNSAIESNKQDEISYVPNLNIMHKCNNSEKLTTIQTQLLNSHILKMHSRSKNVTNTKNIKNENASVTHTNSGFRNTTATIQLNKKAQDSVELSADKKQHSLTINSQNVEQAYDEKCIEIIKEKIQNSTCLNKLLEEILSDDIVGTQHNETHELSKKHTQTTDEGCESMNTSSEIKRNQHWKHHSDNLLHEDNMLKLITEEVQKYKSQSRKIIDDGTYGIKDFLKNLPQLSETFKPYIKRYKKDTTKIYVISKLKKKCTVSNEESASFGSVIEKMSQNYFGTINNSESYNSLSSVSTSSSYFTDETKSEVLSRGSIDLTSPEKRIRQGVNELLNDKSLLYTKNTDSKIVFKKQQIQKIIQGIFVKVADDFANKKIPHFTFRSHSIQNCIFKDNRLQLKPPNEAQFTRISYGSSSSRSRFNLMLFILYKIKKLLDSDTKLTKRELYYQLKTIIKDQGIVDRAINAVSSLLQVGMWSMNIIAQKGLVFGNLNILLSSGETINCNVPGTLIPQDVGEIIEIQSRAYFILVVEKESIFHKLLEEDLPNKLTRPFIMITGKGYPDLNTQIFLRKLWMVMSIPVFIFVDADPDGISIMLNYRFGSVANAHLSHCLTTPKAKWLGVFPSEIEQFDIDKQTLSQREVNKIKQLLNFPYIKEYPEIGKQLNILLKNNYKAGIEGLVKTDTFLSSVYLPNKFFSHDFL